MKHGSVKNKIIGIGSRPDFWLAALLLWLLVSASRSLGTPWASAALTEALRWGGGIGVALALGRFLRRTEIAGQFLVTLTGTMALFGILGGDNTSHSGLIGPYHDHQLYGSILLLLLPFTAGTAFSAKSLPWRYGALAAFAAGTLCLLLSQTRSAWIGMAVAASVFGWLWLRQSASRLPRLRVIFVPAALLFLGLFGVWLVTGSVSQQAALTQRASTLTALSVDESWQSRLSLWRGTARLISAYPLFGIGLGRYPGVQWFWTHSGDFLAPTAHPSLSNQAHSFYGQTASEVGVIGLALYLAAIVAFTVLGLRRLRERRGKRGFSSQNALLIAVLTALVGQSIDAIASPSWQFPEVSFFFWAVLGLGLATLREKAEFTVLVYVPHPLLRAGRWALSGTLAAACVAQALPLGLTTPIETYPPPQGYTVTAVIISLVSPAEPIPPGRQVQYQLTATWTSQAKPPGPTLYQDISTDAPVSFTGSAVEETGTVNSVFVGPVTTLSGSYDYNGSTKLTATGYYQIKSNTYLSSTIQSTIAAYKHPLL